MPIAITPEQLALQETLRNWAKELDTNAVRDREPGTSADIELTQRHRETWRQLADIGVFAAAISEERGGAGGGVVDVAVALEQTADALVPGPVLPTVLAGLLLDRVPDAAISAQLLPGLVAGEVSAAVATEAGELRATAEDGRARVSGAVSAVLGAGETTHLVLAARQDGAEDEPEAWFVVTADHPGVHVIPRQELDFSRNAATVRLDSVLVEPTAFVPGISRDAVVELAATLASAEATGVAERCLQVAGEHARTREQFGALIGSFQGVKHRCAEMLCEVQRCAAVAWDAARALDEAPAEHPFAAAVAATVAMDAAVAVATDCIQVLGGTGFTWEHDAHLYLRRALALRQLFGGAERWAQRTTAIAASGVHRGLRVPGALLEQAESERSAVRATARRIAALPAAEQPGALADAGYVAPQWPRPHGLAASPALRLIVEEELAQAGVEPPDTGIGGWAIPTLLDHGTQRQRDRFVRPTSRGEITWCQLFSEPEAGSDLAALRTRAERASGGWVLTGQKIWTSLAHDADWAICLARTDPEVAKHRGLTYFLVDMSRPGVTVRPLREITGASVFNEVFLDEVFVPDGDVVGSPGEGWRIARTTLSSERVALSARTSGSGAEQLLDAARRHGQEQDPLACARIGQRIADGSAVSLLGLRATLRRLSGGTVGAESGVEKLLSARHRQALSDEVLRLLGPEGALANGSSGGPDYDFLLSRCLTIAGGTTEVLRNVIGERVLGLPRS